MRKMNWGWSGLVFGFCLVFSGMVNADQPIAAVPTPAQLVLNVQTADGKALQAPVVRFKALSLAVVATLIKEGKMTASQSPEKAANRSANMTFYLDKNVSDDFVNWAKSNMGQTSGSVSNDSGEFTWPSKNGYPAEMFKMQGLRVVGFIPGDDSNGGQLVLAADKTEAFPPINFSKGKK
jgi:hypothetical protein